MRLRTGRVVPRANPVGDAAADFVNAVRNVWATEGAYDDRVNAVRGVFALYNVAVFDDSRVNTDPAVITFTVGSDNCVVVGRTPGCAPLPPNP